MKLILTIEPDDDGPENPRDWDNMGRMVCSHRRYNLRGSEPKTPHINFGNFSNWDEVSAHLIKCHEAFVILPLYLYDHSGITIATTPFSCRWDSGQVGFIYATREDILNNLVNQPKRVTKNRKLWAEQALRQEVEAYDRYLRGEAYCYVIRDEDDNIIESCGGFDNEDYCREQGESELALLTEDEDQSDVLQAELRCA